MERLLKDAQAITGVKYDIDNLADVYTAIGVIQEKLGIAGTTAKEASTTISGAAAMMAASWKNVLTAISGGGDIDRAVENLVRSVETYFKNIIPVIEKALQGIGQLVAKLAPMVVQLLTKSLIQAIPSLLYAVYEMIIGLAKGVYQGIMALFRGTTTEALEQQADNIKKSVKNQKELTEAVEETNEATKKSLAGFDDLQILTSDVSSEMMEEPIVPQVEDVNIAESLEVEETKKEATALEKMLRKIFEKVQKTIKKVWDSEPVQAFWGAVKSIGNTGLHAFQTLGSSLWENLKTTWSNIENDFSLMTSNIQQLWTMFWQDLQIGIDTWGIPIVEGVKGVFDSIWNTAVSPVIELLVGAWTDFTSILKSKWEEYGQPLIKNIGKFVNNVIALFQSIYDNVLEPIITPFLETLSWLWDEHISKLIDNVTDFVMRLINAALDIYNEFIHPIVTWLLDVLAPVWSAIVKYIIGVFGSLFAALSDTVSGIIKFFGGLIDFIVGVFTLDWEQAWQGVKDMFAGVFDALVAIAKAPINLIIDALNLLISGINAISFDLPDWDILGDWAGKTLGFDIPEIPKLAQGAVIPPNKEFLAVLGDQNQGVNIETPLATMIEAFQMALDSRESYNGGNVEVVLELDGREFGRAVVEQGARENRRIGTKLVMA